MVIIKNITMKVEKWFVAGVLRDENGRVNYKSETRLSKGYDTREMAEIECRKIRQTIDNNIMFVTTVRRTVEVQVEKRYEQSWYCQCNDCKIFDAYAEYANEKRYW